MKYLPLILALVGLAACEPVPSGAQAPSRMDAPSRTKIEGTTSSGTGIRIRGDARVGVVTRL